MGGRGRGNRCVTPRVDVQRIDVVGHCTVDVAERQSGTADQSDARDSISPDEHAALGEFIGHLCFRWNGIGGIDGTTRGLGEKPAGRIHPIGSREPLFAKAPCDDSGFARPRMPRASPRLATRLSFN